MERYLKDIYEDDIINLLNDPNEATHISIHVSLCDLQQRHFDWFQAILEDVHLESPKWDQALLAAQKTIATENEAFLESCYQIKVNGHVRFVNLPAPDSRYKVPFPNYMHIGQFREIKASVVRVSKTKLLEVKRDFICNQCKQTTTLEADYELMYMFDAPKQCSTECCKGVPIQKYQDPLPEHCVYYQDIKVQEILSERNIPPTLIVTLENDLVDSCQPGECLTICGTVERRWKSFQINAPCRAVVHMRGTSLVRDQKRHLTDKKHLTEQMMSMQADWAEKLKKSGELGIRDDILKSICPQVHGMYPVKLAIALAICSGIGDTNEKSNDLLHHRGQSHVLLIGDPGLAKSRLLLAAVSIAPRAVHTTGMGCSSAGLTAAAVKEEGEWQLEAGALVLADGGICCIDEFNLMRESDKASIHEAMEQQTISMAKAGILCKLNTRCSVIAAANPKNLYTMSEPEGASCLNIGIASPLLSRFDIILILRDERDKEWDARVSEHLMSQVRTGFKGFSINKDSDTWTTERLHTHFSAIANIRPKMGNEARRILAAYYKMCRDDPERDLSRTTVRLLDSLNRLAEAHARLLFRDDVRVIDAIMSIRMMESSFGFGRIIAPFHVIKEELPLTPTTDEEIQDIYNILGLGTYNEKVNKGPPPNGDVNKLSNGVNNTNVDSVQPGTSKLDEFKKPEKPLGNIAKASQPRRLNLLGRNRNLPTNRAPVDNNISNEDMDKILSLDLDLDIDLIVSSSTKDKKNEVNSSQATTQSVYSNIGNTTAFEDNFGDSDDEMMSQALDDVEKSQELQSPHPKRTKTTEKPTNQSLFSHFESSGRQPLQNFLGTHSQNGSEASQNANRTIIRNRLLCTPSDDESSQSQSSVGKFSQRSLSTSQESRNSLNRKVNETTLNEVQENEIVGKSQKTDKAEEDSAYDSMVITPCSAVSVPLVSKTMEPTAKTPNILSFGSTAPKNSNDNNEEEDLSFLDNLEF